MQERLPYSKGYAIPQIVQKSTGVILHRGLAIGYVFRVILGGAFDLIIQPGPTRPHNRGWATILFMVMADCEDPACSVVNMILKTTLSSQTTMATFFMIPAGLSLGVKTN